MPDPDTRFPLDECIDNIETELRRTMNGNPETRVTAGLRAVAFSNLVVAHQLSAFADIVQTVGVDVAQVPAVLDRIAAK